MTVKEFHTYATRMCGQSDLMLNQVLLNDKLERIGLQDFQQGGFTNCLDRAVAVYMPYYQDVPIHKSIAAIYALGIASHRSESHGEDRADEIESYKQIIINDFQSREDLESNNIMDEPSSEDFIQFGEEAGRSWWTA